MTTTTLNETYENLLSLMLAQHQHAVDEKWLEVVTIQSRYMLKAEALAKITENLQEQEGDGDKRNRMDIIEKILTVQSQTKKLLQKRQAEIAALMLAEDSGSEGKRLGRQINTGTYHRADIRKTPA